MVTVSNLSDPVTSHYDVAPDNIVCVSVFYMTDQNWRNNNPTLF